MSKSTKRRIHPRHLIFLSSAIVGIFLLSNLFSQNGCTTTKSRPCYDMLIANKANILNETGGKNSFNSCITNSAPNETGQASQKTSVNDKEIFSYCFEGKSNVYLRKFEGKSDITPSPSPTVNPTPSPVNSLSMPHAEWSFPQQVSNWGKLGRAITSNFSDNFINNIKSLRLYGRNPGGSYYLITEFSNIGTGTDCFTQPISSNSSWLIYKEKTYSNGQFTCTADAKWHAVSKEILSASNWYWGEYDYYFTAIDLKGIESLPSPIAKQFFLQPLNIISPTGFQSSTNPNFQWTTVSGWPSTPSYHTFVGDPANNDVWLWTKVVFGTNSVQYDGPALDPTKKYVGHVYGYIYDSNSIQYVSLDSATTTFSLGQ